ncbi:hypothetical protein ACOMHN_033767 [Nucella lapillus]
MTEEGDMPRLEKEASENRPGTSSENGGNGSQEAGQQTEQGETQMLAELGKLCQQLEVMCSQDKKFVEGLCDKSLALDLKRQDKEEQPVVCGGPVLSLRVGRDEGGIS